MAKKTATNTTGLKIAIGAGVIGLAGAAYLLFGPEGKKHQKNLKSWMLKMKAEALDKMEKIEELTTPAYEEMVDALAMKYKDMKNVDASDLEAEVAMLQKNFRGMVKDLKSKMPAAKKARA